MVLGHESAGVVTAVGPGVDPGRVGQRVSVEPGVPDMTCEQCLAGRYNLCPDMRFFATPPIDGSLAEFVTVHEAFAHPVPEDMSDDAAALLEPLSVGVWANRKGQGHRWQPGPDHRRRTRRPGRRPVRPGVRRHRGRRLRRQPAPARARPDAGRHRRPSTSADTALAASGFEPNVLLECSGHPGATGEGIRSAVQGRQGGPRRDGRRRAAAAARHACRTARSRSPARSATRTPGPRPSPWSLRSGRPGRACHRPLSPGRLRRRPQRRRAGRALGQGRHQPAAVTQLATLRLRPSARGPAATPVSRLKGHQS